MEAPSSTIAPPLLLDISHFPLFSVERAILLVTTELALVSIELVLGPVETVIGSIHWTGLNGIVHQVTDNRNVLRDVLDHFLSLVCGCFLANSHLLFLSIGPFSPVVSVAAYGVYQIGDV
jgi:hypothetical protein